MTYKPLADDATAADVAEAVGRLYCTSKGKPWPEAPDTYGPGRQPQPLAAYYQRYYTAPLIAIAANPTLGIPAPLPSRVDVDAFTLAQDGKQVTVTGGKQVTLDFKNLTVVAASAEVG